MFGFAFHRVGSALPWIELALATPVVLWGGSPFFERLAVIVDKTGTLTEGKPKLASVVAVSGDSSEFLALAASLGNASEHPLATTVVQGAKERGLSLGEAKDFRSFTEEGSSVPSMASGWHWAVRLSWKMEEQGVSPGPLLREAEKLRTQGHTVMFVARRGNGRRRRQ
jgi:Cu+-exporting ATPase